MLYCEDCQNKNDLPIISCNSEKLCEMCYKNKSKYTSKQAPDNYCKACQVKNGWPGNTFVAFLKCKACGITAMSYVKKNSNLNNLKEHQTISMDELHKKLLKDRKSTNTEDTLVDVVDGKYTVVIKERGGLEALRYGKPWRDLTGDGLVLQLAMELDEARKQLKEIKDTLKSKITANFEEYSCPCTGCRDSLICTR